MVVSPVMFFHASRFAVVCPITSRARPFGTSVALPAGMCIEGEIPTSHVRSIDTMARPIACAGAAVPAGVLAEVRAKLAALLGMVA